MKPRASCGAVATRSRSTRAQAVRDDAQASAAVATLRGARVQLQPAAATPLRVVRHPPANPADLRGARPALETEARDDVVPERGGGRRDPGEKGALVRELEDRRLALLGAAAHRYRLTSGESVDLRKSTDCDDFRPILVSRLIAIVIAPRLPPAPRRRRLPATGRSGT